MKFLKLQILVVILFTLCTTPIYATVLKSDTFLQKRPIISSQTLADSDGDGYFAFKTLFPRNPGIFSLKNDGTSRVDVTLYSANTNALIWSARINPNKTATSTTHLPFPFGKYYFIVISDDGSPLNVTCTAKY